VSQFITCEGCGKKLRVSDETPGRSVKCPSCGHRIVLESDEDPDDQESAPSKPLEFKVVIKNDPDKVLDGTYQATVTSKGLKLSRKKEKPVLIPIGTPARYPGGNRLTVTLDERQVEIRVSRFLFYQKRLAKDLAKYLKSKKQLDPAGYKMEWYLLIPVILPIGIPVITLGGAIPGALGFGLAAGCYALVQVEELSLVLRIILALALAGLGYGVLIAMIVATALVRGG